jgi:hypothetical protein
VTVATGETVIVLETILVRVSRVIATGVRVVRREMIEVRADEGILVSDALKCVPILAATHDPTHDLSEGRLKIDLSESTRTDRKGLRDLLDGRSLPILAREPRASLQYQKIRKWN